MRRIGDRARQRPHVIEAQAQRYDASGADQPVAGLQSHHAAIGGRDAHRAAGIRAERRRAQSGGDRRS